MDAFSVSLANGLADSRMDAVRMSVIAGTFAGFQFMMPMTGWVLVHTAASRLEWFSTLVPWIALILLLYIGGKMLREGIVSGRSAASEGSDHVQEPAAPGDLVMQGIATSIDALSVGFTISAYNYIQACATSVIIGIVTFVICMAGLAVGKRAGTFLSGKALMLGGVILIGIGLEIWIRGVFL